MPRPGVRPEVIPATLRAVEIGTVFTETVRLATYHPSQTYYMLTK